MRGWRARARPRGDSAVRPLSREEGEEGRGECVDTLQWATVKRREEGGGRREKRGEWSAWMARSSAPARRFRHASYEEGGGRG